MIKTSNQKSALYALACVSVTRVDQSKTVDCVATLHEI